MTSRLVADRASEFVTSGLVKILSRSEDGRVCSRVGGYRVVRTALGRFRCDCEAGRYRQVCSHATALQIVLESQP